LSFLAACLWDVWDLAPIGARSVLAPDFIVATLAAIIARWLSLRCRRRKFLLTT